MLEVFELSKLPGFILIFARVIGFFLTIPVFSYRNLPRTHKLGFAIFLSWIMFYTVDMPVFLLNGQFILLILKELIVGLLIGLIAFIILGAIQIAGGFIDFQMGFAIANVMDPQTGIQSPLIGQFLYTLALLFLITVDAHHLLLDGIFYSYQYVEIDQMVPFQNESIVQFVMESFSQMFLIAFQMSIPIVGCLFLVDVALGIVARTVPQLNVFVVGLPLKIFVSFVVIFVFLGIYVTLIQQLFETILNAMRGLMSLFGGA
ncbi:flagellar type III secretion system protein FliR [Virgibacillus sp. MSP4-1]|uniref:flagellar biosynthetic protein FliR n=1 Tax=Virgibacillus sp. MSP4-1 TaxID=2700081 RepID=UPI0005C55253|nr:flagellar biosynthetic protein FliR [Virgibacillus sp. MSP4-1]QHS22262.1 flagellar type III secretion system protein FliR [Virgibacillus sp. MSP4-1]